MASTEWKSNKYFAISGSAIKKGVFTGWKGTSGGLTHDQPTDFDITYIERLYRNAQGHIPVVVGHSQGDTTIVGYVKIGITPEHDDLKFKGFVFDEGAKTKIVRGGYNYVSPEIIEDIDSFGNVTPQIAKLALIPNPSIKGTDISVEPIMFSTGDDDMGDEEDKTIGKVTPPADTEKFGKSGKPIDININVTGNDKPEQKNEPTKNMGDDVALAMAELRADNAVLKKAVEKMLTERLDGIISELKREGVEEPDKIVHGLPTEQKIAVLSKMKETVVKTKPPADIVNPPNPILPQAQKADIDKAVAEVLVDLGYTVDEYKKLRGE